MLLLSSSPRLSELCVISDSMVRCWLSVAPTPAEKGTDKWGRQAGRRPHRRIGGGASKDGRRDETGRDGAEGTENPLKTKCTCKFRLSVAVSMPSLNAETESDLALDRISSHALAVARWRASAQVRLT